MKKILKNVITPSSIIFILAFLIRIGYLVWFLKFSGQLQSRPYIPTADRRFYDSIADSFLNGYGLNMLGIFKSHYPPFYPIFLAFLYSFFGHIYRSYIAVFFIQTILSSLCPVFVYWVGKKIFNPIVGFIAALLTIFYWPYISVSQDLELENLLIFMPLLFMIVLLNINKNSSLQAKTVGGLIMGLTILTKPVFLFNLPIITFLWLKTINLKNKFWQTLLLIYLSSFLILSIWLVRNFLVHKKLIFSSQSGIGLWLATNPDYKTYSRQLNMLFYWDKPELTEVEKNSYYTTEGINNLRKYPFSYFSKLLTNCRLLFYDGGSNNLSIIILIFSFIGIVIALLEKLKKPFIFLLFLLIFYVQYIFLFAYARFRMPLDWILFIFTSYAIYFLLNFIIIIFFKNKKMPFDKNFIYKFVYSKSHHYIYLNKILFILLLIALAIFITKIGYAYLSPKRVTQININNFAIKTIQKNYNLPPIVNSYNQEKLTYQQIYQYQKDHQGKMFPFVGKIVVWKGEISYLNRNAVYPLGSAKNPEQNFSPEYKDFYDIYYLPSTQYSTFDLIVNRGVKPGYYGDGVVMVNYKGLLDFNFQNGDQAIMVGKIIGQNIFGQIYLEGYGVFK